MLPSDRKRWAQKEGERIRRVMERKLQYTNFDNPKDMGDLIMLAASTDHVKVAPLGSYCKCTPCSEDRYHMYALKKPSNLLYCSGIAESPDQHLSLTSNFSMCHLTFMNMLSGLETVMEGVSYPMLYLGGLHSVFPIHVEDMEAWSFNFLFAGGKKFWYVLCIHRALALLGSDTIILLTYLSLLPLGFWPSRLIVPPTSVRHLDRALRSSSFGSATKICSNRLKHKADVITEEFLEAHKIPFTLVSETFAHTGTVIILVII